ncbi:DMT family transporter [Clostridium sp. Mt-5]|uniref:DMT family transporter n=1 Tax=Clostridium moutaii TaxID=3240932 RepID=A0ABV4BS58_9CLOT
MAEAVRYDRYDLSIVNAKRKVKAKYSRMGSIYGLISGITFALNSVIVGVALAMTPLTLKASAIVAPLVAAAMNDSMTALWLLVYNIIKGRFAEIGRTLKTFPGFMICVAAILGGPFAMGCYLLGIQFAGSAYAMPISALCPVVGAILARIFLKQKMSLRISLGMIICVAGCFIISITPPSGSYPHFYLGILFSFGAAFGWGAEGMISSFGSSVVDPEVAINIRELTSGIFDIIIVLPIIAGIGMFAQIFTAPRTLIIIAGAALAGAVSFLTWYKANNMIGVAPGMALNVTYVLWGLVFSVILTGIALTPSLIIGALACTFGAILVVMNPFAIFSRKKEELQ